MATPTPYPDWIHTRLANMFGRQPRYENSYYGPINAILNCIFPVGQQFLVKPQAVIRPTRPVEASIYLPPGSQPHPQATRSSSRVVAAALKQPAVSTHGHHSSVDSQVSVDSTGDATLPRMEGGWETILIPDFLVVKGTAAMDGDVLLALVEVKLNATEEVTSINQVEEYLEALQSKNYADEFVAFLSMGPRTIVWTTQRQGNDRRQFRWPQAVLTGDMHFCEFLKPLRLNHWN